MTLSPPAPRRGLVVGETTFYEIHTPIESPRPRSEDGAHDHHGPGGQTRQSDDRARGMELQSVDIHLAHAGSRDCRMCGGRVTDGAADVTGAGAHSWP